MLADVAALATTDVARDVHLSRGLGEGEIRRTETHLGAFAEELLHEVVQGLLQVGKGDVLVDVEALNLMEDAVGASRDSLVAEHTARGDDADGRLVGFHHADLHARGVGAQQHIRGLVDIGLLADEEGVLHVTSGVVEREVQGREHVVVVLDLGAFGNGEAEVREDLVDVAAHNRQRVTGTLHVGSGHAHVEAGIVAVLVLKLLQLLLHLVLHDVLQLVELHAHLLAELRGHILEIGKQSGDDAFLAQISDAEVLQGLFAVGLEVTHLG